MDYDDEGFDYKFKVIFTGEMGVGKTRLIQRYARKMFNEEQELPATIGQYAGEQRELIGLLRGVIGVVGDTGCRLKDYDGGWPKNISPRLFRLFGLFGWHNRG